MCLCPQFFSPVRRFATPLTAVRQALLSMGFTRQKCRSGLLFPSPGIFPTQESNQSLLHWQADSLPLSHLGSPCFSQSVSSVTQSCPTLCDPMNRSTSGLPVHHQLREFTQTHVHRVGDATQSSHPLLSPSHPAPNPSHHQGLFQ